MNKVVSYLACALIGMGIGYLIWGREPSEDNTIKPQIDLKRQEIAKRQPREVKLEDTIKTLKFEVKRLSEANTDKDAKFKKAEAKYKESKKAIPVTRKDTIRLLMLDTAACDTALLRASELISGLSSEIIKDNAIIEDLDSLNSDLEEDKRELKEIDSLHVQTEKQLRKAGRKKFFKGLGVGGVLGVILALLL